jgi:LPXTG-motif cell wall-anchored protein
MYASPEFAMPDQPGLLSLVETVADADGKVIRRGACGLVNETAVLLPPPPEEPEPRIITTAPEHAQVGDKITDEALLTGPFPKGTQVEFWYQRTDYINPGAAKDELKCETPDADEMDGAVKIGTTELEGALGAGETAKLLSPEFTSDQEGCTWIKEIAWSPDSDSPDRMVLAQGRFGTVSERTMWHQPPKPGPSAETGGKTLPMTGADTGPWLAIGGVALLLGTALLAGAKLKRRKAPRQ